MTGLRKRVTTGFVSIVCLLFFSGMVSFLELSHLSRDTEDILKANARNIELAREMLDAAHEQNIALMHLSVFGDREYDSLCRASMERLESALLVAQTEALDKSFLDSLAFATTELRLLTDSYLTWAEEAPEGKPATASGPDSLRHGWYDGEYEALYGRLTSAIKNYMTSTQSSLAPRAEQMKKNAYRAVTPVLISLAVMIAIVLMLSYFMNLYCVDPVLKMNKGLGDYLAYRVPFVAKGDFKDEMLQLKEKIDALIALSKQQKN